MSRFAQVPSQFARVEVATSLLTDSAPAGRSAGEASTGSWRGLYVVDGQPRAFDEMLGLRGVRWHAHTRFLAAFAQSMRRHF